MSLPDRPANQSATHWLVLGRHRVELPPTRLGQLNGDRAAVCGPRRER